MTTLTLKEPTSPMALMKRAWEEEQHSPRIECSLKRTRVAKDDAFEEGTPFIEILDIFSRLCWTGDKLAPCIPFKDRDTWKEKGKVMKLKCTNLQKELFALQKEVNVANSLQEAVKVHGSASLMAACGADLKDALKDAEKGYKVAFDSSKEKAHWVEKY